MRRWQLAGLLVAAGLLASGCTADDLPRFGWPSGVTDQAKHMQHFWSWAVIAALSIGVLVWGLMFWTFAFHRKKKNSPLYPKQTKENLPLEIVYSVVPFLMVLVLFYFTVTTEDYVTKTVANPAVTIDVTAQKWAWDFGYEGTTTPTSSEAASAAELKISDYNAREVHTIGTPTEVPILVLPMGKLIEYHLESADVIHSFWVVPFLFKRDVFPNPKANNTDNIIQNTIEQTGAFVGRCAELCGTYHSDMNFEVRAVPADVYDAYIALRQKVDPATGLSYRAAAALTVLGQQFPDCGDLCAPRSITTFPFDTDREARAASQQPAGGN